MSYLGLPVAVTDCGWRTGSFQDSGTTLLFDDSTGQVQPIVLLAGATKCLRLCMLCRTQT